MIAPSEFNAIAAAGLGSVTLAITEKYNGTNSPLPYYHRRFLTPRYSMDGTWNALQSNHKAIVADIVSLDSSIPLKTRPGVSAVSGELPKIATERNLNESELRQLRLMMAAGYDLLIIQREFFKDVEACYTGILEQWEALTLQGLSSGIILVDENTNVGTGVRIDFGYKAANLFNPTIVWGQTGYTPVSDLTRVAEAARMDGNPIARFFMPVAQKNQILSSTEAKNIYANSQGIATGAFNPTLEQFNTAVKTTYGWEIETVERPVTYEINGVQTTKDPWKAGQIVGVVSDKVGSLVYSEVEENTARVAGVNYSAGENNILLKQFRLVRPSLKQITASEAVSLPVISEVNRIYKLDVTVLAV